MSHPVTAERVGARGISAVGALLAVLVAALHRGRMHADEVFQFLEPAHGLVFGYWLKAWEWVEGLRNWAVPGTLGGILSLCKLVGLEHPWALVSVVWVCCASVQALGTVALFRLVEEREGRPAALLASVLYATWGGWLLYAARPLGDAVSVAPLLGALLWAWRARERDSVHAGLWSGVLLALAFVVRYPSAVFGVPIAVSLLAGRRWRSLAGFALGTGAVLLALGLLDWATWGAPWHSAWKYFHFNIFSGGSGERFGRKAWWWYAPTLAGMVPLLLVWHFGRGLARRDVLVGAFAFYLGVVSALGHKEARFLTPLIPLFIAIAAGPAWRTLQQRVRTRAAWGALAGLYALTSVLAATVQLPIGLRTELIDAMVLLGRRPELTGLLIAGQQEWGTGGYFYLHRDVPLVARSGPEAQELLSLLADPRYSHLLVYRDALHEEAVAGAGLCLQQRWGQQVTLWRRCEASAQAAGALGAFSR